MNVAPKQMEIFASNGPTVNVCLANCNPENWSTCKGETIFGLRRKTPAWPEIKPGDILLMRKTGSDNGVYEIWYLLEKIQVSSSNPAPWTDADYDWILKCGVVAVLPSPFSEDFRSEPRRSTKIANLAATRIQSSLVLLKPWEAVGYIEAILNEFEDALRFTFTYLDGPVDAHAFLVRLAQSFAKPDNSVEEEDTLSVTGETAQPYDASKIKVDLRPYSVFQIMRKIKLGEIDLQPDFQRHIVWDPVRRSRLIESILIRIPLPAFYLDSVHEQRWLVVDGLQRLSTLNEFYNDGGLRLTGLEFLKELNGRNFKEIPRQFQRQIEETILNLYIIQPDTPANVKFTIFYRINTGGMVLTPQEIRHCLFQGPATGFLKRLAGGEEFASATTNSIPTKRMDDRECVLRFCAFYRHNFQDYSVPDLDGFLGQEMQDLNSCSVSEYEEIEEAFRESMKKANLVFGRHAFRKMDSVEGGRFPINKALFEAWSVMLARYPTNLLVKNKDKIVNGFISAIREDYKFLKSISSATGSVGNVRKRFSTISTILERAIA